MDEGRFPEAVEIYRDLLKNDASNAGLVMNLGLALDGAGKPREAIAQFERVLKLDPDFACVPGRWKLLAAVGPAGQSPGGF